MQDKLYGRALSTVFGDQEKEAIRDEEDDQDEDDHDPVINHLRLLEYRYIRLFFHPVKDLFVLGNGWKDPSWVHVKSLRVGLDGEERESRMLAFGRNMIDIEQQSIPQLLVDQV